MLVTVVCWWLFWPRIGLYVFADSGLADSQSMRNGGNSGFSSEGTGTDGEVTARSIGSLNSHATLTGGHTALRHQVFNVEI